MSPPKATKERFWCSHCMSVFRTSFARCPLDGTELGPLVGDPLVGMTLADRFIIEECIGEGGMGRVYRARHKLMSRRYAIKVLFGDLVADAKMRTRFSHEAEAASRLSHPNVVSVTDFGESPSGQMFLVMDHVEGESLRTLIRREAPFDARRTAYLLWQMASGLDHAHQRDLVHRDFKPDNVMVVTEEDIEVPKILDFGIVHITEEGYDNNLTTAGTVMGTPAYMSPEHAIGGQLDGRTDLFSLGVVLYQMLSGKLPFDGPGPSMVQLNITTQPPPINVRVPGLVADPDLEQIAFILMAKDPARRFQTARELIDTLIERGLIATTPSSASIAPRPTMMRSITIPPADDPDFETGSTELSAAQPYPFEDPTTAPHLGHADPAPYVAEAPAMPRRDASESGMYTHLVASMDPGLDKPKARGRLVVVLAVLAVVAGLALVLGRKSCAGGGSASVGIDANAPMVVDDRPSADAGTPDPVELDAAAHATPVDAAVPDARRKVVQPRDDTVTVADFKERYNQVAGLVDQLVKQRPKSQAARKLQSEFLKIDYMGSIDDKAARKANFNRLARLRVRIRKELAR